VAEAAADAASGDSIDYDPSLDHTVERGASCFARYLERMQRR
jgi:hypothetical protein